MNGSKGGGEEEEGRMGGTVMFVTPTPPWARLLAATMGMFPFSDARVSADVKTIGPNSVYVLGHRQDFK